MGGKRTLLNPLNTSNIIRFPRTEDQAVLFMSIVRSKYKPPAHNPHVDGEYNPADMIIRWLLGLKKKDLRYRCECHSLDSIGTRFQLLKRMYLHWRAAKLATLMEKLVGKGTYIGYGKGYENTRKPTCHCGSMLREDYGKKKVMIKGEIYRKYYPRYSRKRIHFPRLDRD